jgi:hypothetical protein
LLVVALVALSMLAHGGAAFSSLAMIPFAWSRLRRTTRVGALAGLGVAAVLYLPWIAFQQFVDPPGDRLIKWQLLGVTWITHDSLLHSFIHRYAGLTPATFLGNKWNNLITLFWNHAMYQRYAKGPGWFHGINGLIHGTMLNSVVLAAGPLLFGAAALLWPATRRHLTGSRPLVAFVVLSILVWVLLLWGSGRAVTVILQGPYSAFVLLFALCALGVTALPRPVAISVAVLDAVWFLWLWMPGLGIRSAWGAPVSLSSFDGAMALVSVLSVGAVAIIGSVVWRPRARPLSSLATGTPAPNRRPLHARS